MIIKPQPPRKDNMRFQLIDDGTLDTVILDTETKEEHRFNFQNSEFTGTYDEFVDVCIDALESEV